MTRKQEEARQQIRKRLAVAVVWIVLGGIFMRSCYLHNSTKTTPSPLELGKTRVRPQPPRKVKIEIRDYKVQSIDKYRFKVTFRVVNAGKRAADGVHFTLHPWVAGGLIPDKGDDIDPKDPILKKGKDQYIGRMEPGQSVSCTMEFYEVDGYYPGLAYVYFESNLSKFDFYYTDAP